MRMFHWVAIGIVSTWGCVSAAADTITASAAPQVTTVESIATQALLATFTDSQAGLPASGFFATINWGDGTPATPGTVASQGSQFAVTGSHTYAEDGTYTPSVVIASSLGGTAAVNDTAIVADAALTGGVFSAPAAVEGNSLDAVGTFQDANLQAAASDFAATINWGDNTVSVGTVVSAGNGQFEVMGGHTYAEEGTYSVQVSVNDDGGSQVQLTGTVNAADAPLTGQFLAFPATVGTQFQGTVADFTDGNPGAPPSDFDAVINWGDGFNSVGTVFSSGGGSFAVEGRHTYASSGVMPVSVNIFDIGGSATAFTGDANVAAAGVPEPADWTLLAAGAAVLAAFRRPRRRNSAL